MAVKWPNKLVPPGAMGEIGKLSEIFAFSIELIPQVGEFSCKLASVLEHPEVEYVLVFGTAVLDIKLLLRF